MDIDARSCNMASEGKKIFPRRLEVNVKETSGTYLITLWWANILAQMYTRSYTYITSRVKGSHHFRAQNGPKNIFYGKNIFNEKIYMFHVSLHPFQGAKDDKTFSNTQIHKRFSIKDFISKCDQIRRKLRVSSNLLKKSLMEKLVFCTVTVVEIKPWGSQMNDKRSIKSTFVFSSC